MVPPISSTACCGTREVGTTAPSSFLVALISSRTQATGATARSTVLGGSGGYFVDEYSATIRP